jgi:hypothetical protein
MTGLSSTAEPVAVEAGRIRAEEKACFEQLCRATAPERRRALVAKMSELQVRAAEIERSTLRRRRLEQTRPH